MKEKIFEKVNEKVYEYTLDNGIKVMMYPFQKTKNFYITISVRYGSKYQRYKKGNNVYSIIPGSAHFLEHKIMAVGENEKISNKLNNLGSLANAWTGYDTTNYNIFGSIDINENIKLLLDMFYGPTFTAKDVEEEKGIISEEVDMGKDNINKNLNEKLNKNLFHKTHAKDIITGEKSDLKKISYSSLKKVYNDFYIPNNTFIVITGNFIKEDVLEEIKKYYNSLKLKQKELPKYLKPREPENVKVEYEEVKKDSEEVRVKYAIKINKKIFNYKIFDEDILLNYLNLILKINFGSTSKLYEEYKNKKLMFSLGSGANIIEDYVIIVLSAVTDNPDGFLNKIKNDILEIKLEEKEFERKKKNLLRSFIMSFENIEDVEYILTQEYSEYKKIDYKEYSRLLSMNYEEALKIMKKINNKHVSIIRTIK